MNSKLFYFFYNLPPAFRFFRLFCNFSASLTLATTKMTESCPVQSKIEKTCHTPCTWAWKSYEACGFRINNFDNLGLGELQEIAHHHDIHYVDPISKHTLTREELLGNLKAVANCTDQYNSYWKCVDACTAKRLFTQLK